jgi:hypothetical protein
LAFKRENESRYSGAGGKLTCKECGHH